MTEHKKSIRFSLAVTYIFMALLAVATFMLPSVITLYVEKMHRSGDLATVVMLAYYPCLPVAAVVLFKLRTLLKNFLDDNFASMENVDILKIVAICCLLVGVFLVGIGFFYMPFYFLGAAAAFCSLLAHVFKNIMHGVTVMNEENEDNKDTDVKAENE